MTAMLRPSPAQPRLEGESRVQDGGAETSGRVRLQRARSRGRILEDVLAGAAEGRTLPAGRMGRGAQGRGERGVAGPSSEEAGPVGLTGAGLRSWGDGRCCQAARARRLRGRGREPGPLQVLLC